MFQTIYDTVTTTLQYVADSVDNPRKLSDDAATANTDPPLYVWEPVSIDDASDKGENFGTRNPRAYGYDAHNWNVGCWGATRSDCETLRLALIRAVREGVNVRNYVLGSAQWAYPEWSRVGYVLLVPVTVYLPQVAVEIPTAAGTGIPETDVINDMQETVEITTVNPTDTTGAVANDGTLQGGEG